MIWKGLDGSPVGINDSATDDSLLDVLWCSTWRCRKQLPLCEAGGVALGREVEGDTGGVEVGDTEGECGRCLFKMEKLMALRWKNSQTYIRRELAGE